MPSGYPEKGAIKRYPGDTSAVAGIVILSFGGERSGRDLNCQSPLTLWIK